MEIEKVTEHIVRVLDRIINAIDVLINSFIKLIDYTIKTLENVSRKILSLFSNVLRLSFYILPFILFIIIGNERDWKILFYTGIGVLLLVAVLFVRDLFAQFQGDDKPTEEKTSKTGRVVFIILLLNIITILYSISYFFFELRLEEVIKGFFQNELSSMFKKQG